MIEELVKKYGLTGKFVRAYCRYRGWKHTANGAPKEWYLEWPIIGEQLSKLR